MIIEERNLSRKEYLRGVQKESGVSLTSLRSPKSSTWAKGSIISSKTNQNYPETLSGYLEGLEKENSTQTDSGL